MTDKCLIIAEAGVNHNGDIQLAKKLCLEAKNAGADVVKFQTWITEKIITKSVSQAEYQVKNTNNNQSQFEMLKKLELSFEQFKDIKQYCDEIGIMFASTADEKESLDFLLNLNIPFVKIGSGDCKNIPFLRYVGSKNKPVILSTGMCTLSDVEIAVEELKHNGLQDITLLHCTTDYPCAFDNVNLLAMDTLSETFNLPIGYSDHTLGIEVPIAAVARGAKVIEKHFTLDRNMEGPDHIESIESNEFCKMVEAIRNIEKSLGSSEKRPSNEEKNISNVVEKKIVAIKDIKKGTKISEEMVACKRSDIGVSSIYWDKIIGSVAIRDYAIDEGIEQ